jgi:hypothetical protein
MIGTTLNEMPSCLNHPSVFEIIEDQMKSKTNERSAGKGEEEFSSCREL